MFRVEGIKVELEVSKTRNQRGKEGTDVRDIVTLQSSRH